MTEDLNSKQFVSRKNKRHVCHKRTCVSKSHSGRAKIYKQWTLCAVSRHHVRKCHSEEVKEDRLTCVASRNASPPAKRRQPTQVSRASTKGKNRSEDKYILGNLFKGILGISCKKYIENFYPICRHIIEEERY
ncbi:hypothetical protein HAX54_011884 [Datura stramonium]|uniref:Uncharacterized protein n=1 Tax=Datura stramonium TaxID=4076 RepID=A0ABS8TIT4_DATST|nr:hypothetical protein [Datura stramonium]